MTLNEWIIFGETGISSKTMWAAIMGVGSDKYLRGKFDVPHDKADFGRCYKLVKYCNLNKSDLEKVKTAFPWFAPFIDYWDTLVDLYENNREMYEYMEALVDESRILGGWKKIDNQCWRFSYNI